MPKSTSDSCCDGPQQTVAKGGGKMGAYRVMHHP